MIGDLKKVYDEWNQKRLVLEDFKDFIEITTPFVDMNHDYIQLYLTRDSQKYKITDDGYVINELDIMGINIRSSEKRKAFFNMTLKIFGVNYNDKTDELFVLFDNINDYPELQHRLIQCILRISDMLLTSRNTVISIFTEEVAAFFDKNDVFYTDGLSFIGVSGKAQNFDFILPRSKNKKEKLIKAINTPSADNYMGPLFSWIDVKDTRNKSDFIILANDTNTSIKESFIGPFNNYHVQVLEWSKREQWVDELKII